MPLNVAKYALYSIALNTNSLSRDEPHPANEEIHLLNISSVAQNILAGLLEKIRNRDKNPHNPIGVSHLQLHHPPSPPPSHSNAQGPVNESELPP